MKCLQEISSVPSKHKSPLLTLDVHDLYFYLLYQIIITLLDHKYKRPLNINDLSQK